MGAAKPRLDRLHSGTAAQPWQTNRWQVEAERPSPPPSLWHPQLFLWVSLGTIAVIAAASLYKISELSAGGETVALMLGGRPVDPQTTDLAERRLLNVVEEMALAAGMPVPRSISSTASRASTPSPPATSRATPWWPSTAGCLDYLTREELQGVMGHEFSHILNGDMRLNFRLIGIVFGILCLAVIGYYSCARPPTLVRQQKDEACGCRLPAGPGAA